MKILTLVFTAITMLTSLSAAAEGTIGRITDLQLEKGLIEIDGVYFSLPSTKDVSNAPQQSKFSSLKPGLIVKYSANDFRLRSINIIENLNHVPH